MSINPPAQGRKTADALVRGARKGFLTHAYIFEGEQGLGKREVAYYFAEALLCENKDSSPCGECECCRQAMGKNNPDLKSYSLKELVEKDKKSIGVDDIREIISDAYTKPFKSKYKVYIIEDADALTIAAQNAMLKILEEPPEYIIFIICVTSAAKILSTVQSRSRIVRFSPCTDDEVRAYVKYKYPHMADKADFAASYSQGVLKKADELFEDGKIFSLRNRVFSILKELLTGTDELKVLKCADELDEMRQEMLSGTKKTSSEGFSQVLDLFLSFAMDILKIKTGAFQGVVNRDMEKALGDIASCITYNKAANCAEKVTEALYALSRHVSFKAMSLSMCIGIWDS